MQNCMNCGNNASGDALQQSASKQVKIQLDLEKILQAIHSKALSLREGLIIWDYYQKNPDLQNQEKNGWTYRGVFDGMSVIVAQIGQLKNQYWKLTGAQVSTGRQAEEDILFFEKLQLRKSEFFAKSDDGQNLDVLPEKTLAGFSLLSLKKISTPQKLVIAAGVIIAGVLIFSKK